MKQKEPITTISIELGQNSMARLEALKSKMEANSFAEVMKNALRLLEFAIETESSGFALLAQRPDGTTRAMSVF